MKASSFQGIFLAVLFFILCGCNLTGELSSSDAAFPPTQGVSVDQGVRYSLRLPLIKNGTEYTPTPFLPIQSTPVVTPTPFLSDSVAQAHSSQPNLAPVTPIPEPMPLLGDQANGQEDLINVLLIGADRGSGSIFRTDTLIIASIRPRQQIVTLISIPRDLFVYIPGWTMQRINTAYLHGQMIKYPGGGVALLRETIRYNLGIRIDHYAIVDFNGFKKIVDTLGGIDLPLVCPYTDWRVINPNRDLENPDNWRLYTVGPGLVHMDGDLALWYARSRLRSNDFDRGRRQQETLRAIYQKALNLNVVPKLPDLYAQIEGSARTDIGLNEVLALAPMTLKLDAPRIRSYYISNKYVKGWWTPQGAYVLLPRREKLEPMLQEAMSPPDGHTQARLSVLVEICNNSTKAGIEILAAERLHYAGYETRIVPSEAGTVSNTHIIDYTGGQQSEPLAFLLKYLGLNANRVHSSDYPGNQAAFRLVLGEDYDPCFNPAKINR